MAARSVTSHVLASALPPAARTRSTTGRMAVSGSSEVTMTWAPLAASKIAVAAPMPVPPPVTMAILPSSMLHFPDAASHVAFPDRHQQIAWRVGVADQMQFIGFGGPRPTAKRSIKVGLRLVEGDEDDAVGRNLP